MGAAAQIFISYRRSDSSKDARAVYERLCRAFGQQNVFIDLEGIAPGQDFVEQLTHKLDGCDALVALMGPGWVSARNEQEALRLFDPDDFVRIELSTALGRGIKVLPVLIDGAQPLRAEQLPEPLQALARRQAITLDVRRFDADMQQLVRAIRAETGTPPRRWLPHALGGLVALGAAALWLSTGGLGQRSEPRMDAEAPPLIGGDTPAAAAPSSSVPGPLSVATDARELLRQLKAANVRNSVGDRQLADWLDDADRHYLRLAEACLRLIGPAHLSAEGADMDKIAYLYSEAIGLKGDGILPPEHRVDAALLSKAIVDAYKDKNGGSATELSQLLR